ncbi:methyltransferase domain-containing protein [Candidatus Dojkabacteria bacterium]|nr:methyltransferase domain-containing protein [Candidatus Dojkabacteria bacterium]
MKKYIFDRSQTFSDFIDSGPIESKFRALFKESNIPYFPIKLFDSFYFRVADISRDIAREFQMKDDPNEKWNYNLIRNLISKGFNPAALGTIVTSTKILVEEGLKKVSPLQDVTILELGCGAGWSTVILNKYLSDYYGNKYKVITVDKSIHSISCAAQLLSFYNIPFCVVNEVDKSLFEDQRYQVILCLSDYQDIISQVPSRALSGLYSSHGITYLPYSSQLDLLRKAKRTLCKSASIIIDSLTSDLVLGLDQGTVVRNVIFGGNYRRIQRNPKLAGTYILNGSITKMQGVLSSKFLDFLHYLLFRYPKVFQSYLNELNRSVESQKLLSDWVRARASDYYTLSKFDVLPVPYIVKKIPLQFREIYLKEHPYIETVWFTNTIDNE